MLVPVRSKEYALQLPARPQGWSPAVSFLSAAPPLIGCTLALLALSCSSSDNGSQAVERAQGPLTTPTKARPAGTPTVDATGAMSPPSRVRSDSQPAYVTVQAVGRFFFPGVVQVRAGNEVTVTFENEDPGVIHDLSFRITGVPGGATCTGPCSYSYSFVAPEPGRYEFFCSVHPYIVGTLIIEP